MVVPSRATRRYDRFSARYSPAIADRGEACRYRGLGRFRHTLGDSLPTFTGLASLIDHAVDDIADITQRHERIVTGLSIQELDPARVLFLLAVGHDGIKVVVQRKE